MVREDVPVRQERCHVNTNLRKSLYPASGYDCATTCCLNAGYLGISLASRACESWLLLLFVVRDVTRISVMWEKYPGDASATKPLSGEIHLSRT